MAMPSEGMPSVAGNATAGGWRPFFLDHLPNIQAGPSDLLSTIAIDGATLATAFVVWAVKRALRRSGAAAKLGLAAPNFRPKNKVATNVVHNYATYLEECRRLFIAQTVLSALFTVPLWGLSPIAVGLGGGTINTAGNLSSTGLSILCADTILRGLVALYFIERLRRRIRRPVFRKRERDQIHRTLWLTGLPVYDSATGAPFMFDDTDFEQVAQDLRQALVAELNKEVLGLKPQMEVRAHIAPVVDKWHKVSKEMWQTRELEEAYRSMLDSVGVKSCWGRLQARRFSRELRRLQAHRAKLQHDLDRVVREKKKISGAAFVTFPKATHRDHFLKEKPQCWQCRRFAFFTFGRPPFASVTLACTRAPHPDDVNWLNLHVSRFSQVFRGGVLIVLLFVVMLVLVTPVTYASQISVILPALRKRVDTVADWLHEKNVIGGHGLHFWYSVTNQLPAMLLVIINSLLLPECIYRIAEAVRLHMKSSAEIIQLHLNYTFLVLNALIIPMLGLTSISTLIEWGKRRIGVPLPQLLMNVSQKMLQSSGVFALRYILNCACLSNANSLLQLPQIVYQACARFSARTPRELVEAEEQWVYAWGYWYAWTISIFTIGMTLSTLVPSVLPCTALFFAVQHFVDSYNLMNDIYRQGPDSENSFITRALHYMRCVVGGWWAVMGLCFLLVVRQGLAENWDSRVPLYLVEHTCLFFIVGGIGLILWSWWDQQSILHDSHFQMVDIARRGTQRNRLFNCFEKVFGETCMQGDYRNVPMGDAEATDLEGPMDGKATDMEALLSATQSLEVFEDYKLRMESSSDEENEKDPTAPNAIVETAGAEISWDACSVVVCSESAPI